MANTQLIEEITDLTMRLKNEHPEIYDRLNENPITLKLGIGHGVMESELRDYLATLKELLRDHGG